MKFYDSFVNVGIRLGRSEGTLNLNSTENGTPLQKACNRY